MAALTALLVMLTGPAAPLQQERRFAITRDTVISGVPCAPTKRARASVFPKGQLSSCPLSRDSVHGSLRIEAGTWVNFTERGSIKSVWLNEPRNIRGVPCRGDGYKTWVTELYPSGRLRQCFLSRPTEIEGVPCRDSWFWSELRRPTWAILRDNGRLESCVLSRDFERDGVRFRKNSRIQFDRSGSVVKPDSRL